MSNKHEVNVQKSTLVNFQIGLVASLLFTYVIFEVYTTAPVIHAQDSGIEYPDENPYVIGEVQVYKVPKKEMAVKTVRKKRPSLSTPEIIKDTEVLDKFEEEFKASSSDDPEPSSSQIESLPEEEVIEYDFTAVEFVPVFPGCEELATNAERASCFSNKINRLVTKKFNTDLASELGLSGMQRIYVQFEIGTDGTVQNIRTRAPHPRLEKEALRIVKKFPIMTPGKQRDKNVSVKYQLPITFRIAN